jgi:hypothetical protein
LRFAQLQRDGDKFALEYQDPGLQENFSTVERGGDKVIPILIIYNQHTTLFTMLRQNVANPFSSLPQGNFLHF